VWVTERCQTKYNLLYKDLKDILGSRDDDTERGCGIVERGG
jgi:hypothetical protein